MPGELKPKVADVEAQGKPPSKANEGSLPPTVSASVPAAAPAPPSRSTKVRHFNARWVSFHLIEKTGPGTIHYAPPKVFKDGGGNGYAAISEQLLDYIDEVLLKAVNKVENTTRCLPAYWDPEVTPGVTNRIQVVYDRLTVDSSTYAADAAQIASYYADAVPSNNRKEQVLVIALVRPVAGTNDMLAVLKVDVKDESRLTIKDFENVKFEEHQLINSISTSIAKGALIPHPKSTVGHELKVIDNKQHDSTVNYIAQYFLSKFLRAITTEPAEVKINKVTSAIATVTNAIETPLTPFQVIEIAEKIAVQTHTLNAKKVVSLIEETIGKPLEDTVKAQALKAMDVEANKPFKLEPTEAATITAGTMTLKLRESEFEGITVTGPISAMKLLLKENSLRKTKLLIDEMQPYDVNTKPKPARRGSKKAKVDGTSDKGKP